MKLLTQIARRLAPELALDADAAWRMRVELETDVQWLAEFPAVRAELQRLIGLDRAYTGRPYSRLQDFAYYNISDFREMLRREHAPLPQQGGKE